MPHSIRLESARAARRLSSTFEAPSLASLVNSLESTYAAEAISSLSKLRFANLVLTGGFAACCHENNCAKGTLECGRSSYRLGMRLRQRPQRIRL